MTETEQLEQAATQLQEARDGVDKALAHAREVTLAALDAGLAEAAVARTLRVSRTTIRTWTGK
ncbi:hypothetical protein [Microbacterium oleivorans]|uniref:Helix-turn-helix domain-containing protein n=1 Tax=Microbacterium oleivorans TaxID=273677 RepID=A0A7D5EVR1_9MICO|nr:hypothetical protein [Microbacterium oleivorans]QLD10884.1 hypothetical protein HW566_03250 [Microbacterium oleivorans]